MPWTPQFLAILQPPKICSLNLYLRAIPRSGFIGSNMLLPLVNGLAVGEVELGAVVLQKGGVGAVLAEAVEAHGDHQRVDLL